MTQETYDLQRFGQEQGPLQLMELQMMARSGQIKASTLVRREGGSGSRWANYPNYRFFAE